jgi:hypothetical protein
MDNQLISLPVGAQEHRDQGKEIEHWKTMPPDSTWAPVCYLGAAGLPPWINLAPRPVPRPLENPLAPRLVWQGRGTRTGPATEKNLAILFNRETIHGEAAAIPAAANFFGTRPENIRTFDFGKTRFIRPVLDIEQSGSPVRFELYYDIKFEGRPTASLGFGSPMEGGCDSYLSSNGHSRWELLAPRGFRFLTVKSTGRGTARFRLSCRSVDYPYLAKADFQCADPFFQKVWDISRANIRSSTTDTAVDCCSRENLLWTMDAAVTMKAAFYSFGETAQWRYCLDLVGQGIDPDGRPSAVVPTDVPSSLFCQTMFWVISLYEYYMATGDAAVLADCAGALSRFLNCCRQNLTAENLFVPPAYSWHWLDWAPIDKRPYSMPINALLVLASDAAVRIAAGIGNRPLLNLAGDLARRLRLAIPSFFDHRQRAFRSHLEPRKKLNLQPEKPNSRTSDLAKTLSHNIYSNILPALAGCGAPAMRLAALRHAASLLRKPRGPLNQMGMGTVDVLLAPLMAAGYSAEVRGQLSSMYHALY